MSNRFALLLALVSACTTEAVSTVRDAEPLGPCPSLDAGPAGDSSATGLCREAFYEDADGGVAQDMLDASDVADGEDSVDLSTRLGQRCSLLNACNELSGRVCCSETVKCTLDNLGLGICVAAGDKEEGDDCGADGTDDCIAGLFCVGKEESVEEPTCHRFCNPLAPECPAGWSCTERIPWVREAIGLCVR